MVPRLNLILTLICRDRLADQGMSGVGSPLLSASLGADNPLCQTPEIQSLATRFSLYASLLGGFLSALTSPKIGALSDHYGRTRLIAVTTTGLAMFELVTIVTATWSDYISVYWLLLGSVLDGACGSFTSSMALTHSYAADCTPPARRSGVFGYFHGALFAGIAIGPLISGYIVKATGSFLSIFYIALACHILYIFFVLLIVPDSLSRERQLAAREKHRLQKESTLYDDDSARPANRKWSISRGLKAANLLAPLEILYPTGPGTSRALRVNLILLSAVDTITFGVVIGAMTVIVYYSEYAFGWGNLESSIFVSIVNVLRVFVLIVLLPLLNALVRRRRARQSAGSTLSSSSGADLVDLSIIRLGIFFQLAGYLGFVVVRSGDLFTAAAAITAFGSMASPTVQSTITKHVPPDRTGQVLGATGLLHALARIVAPAIFDSIYSVTVGRFTQTAFVCMAACFGLASLLSWFIKPHGMSLSPAN
jgi:MFS family permease